MPHVTPLRPDDPRHVGRYQLAGRMSGMPGTGPTYLGDGPDGRQVTISLLGSDWTDDSAARDRFAAEASAAKRVQPFCAARLLDSGLDSGRAYLVREYVAGASLLELVSAEGEMRRTDLDGLAIGMATGLLSVHEAGLVHGSFGPEHVIMSCSGPKVVEFGITPPYGMATPAADMLAWARTTLFAALARPPASMSDLDVLPAQLREVVTGCLSSEPAERPLTRSVVVELLGGTEPSSGALAEGARLAVHAAAAPPLLAAGQQPGQHYWPEGPAPLAPGRPASHSPIVRRTRRGRRQTMRISCTLRPSGSARASGNGRPGENGQLSGSGQGSGNGQGSGPGQVRAQRISGARPSISGRAAGGAPRS